MSRDPVGGSTPAGPEQATIRLGTIADRDRQVELIVDAYAIESFFVSGPRTDRAELDQLAEQGTFLVAEEGDQLLGTVWVRLLEEGGRPLGYFGMLAVAAAARGQRLGRRLIGAAEAWVQERGAREMEIWVVDLRTELFPWYRKMGFAEVGTEPFDSPRRLKPCHFVKMRRRLG